MPYLSYKLVLCTILALSSLERPSVVPKSKVAYTLLPSPHTILSWLSEIILVIYLIFLISM